MVDDDLGPCLELVAHGAEIAEGVKLQVLNGVLIGAHLAAAELKAVNYAEVHAADLAGIIID
jgi:hypothetical protein